MHELRREMLEKFSIEPEKEGTVNRDLCSILPEFKIYTDVVFMSVKISRKQMSQVVHFIVNRRQESQTNQGKL